MKFIILLTFALLVCKSVAQIRIVGPPIYMGSSHDKPFVLPVPIPSESKQNNYVVPSPKYPSISIATHQPPVSNSHVPMIDIEDLVPPPKFAYKATNFKQGPAFYEPLANEDPLVVPPCNISKSGYDTPFALMDNILVPCNEPFILDAIRIGGPLPQGIKVIKSTQQTIAIKIPTPSTSLVGVLASRNNIIQSNISSPIFGRRNPAYHRGVKVKNWKRQTDCKFAPKSQIDLLTSLHTILTNEVRVKGAFAFSKQANSYVKNSANLPPMQIHHLQSYGVSAPPHSGHAEADFRLADEMFGFRGARFEFDESWRTARMIEKSIGKNNIANFTDRNYLSTFRELFRFATNAHMELHNLGEIQSKTVFKHDHVNLLIKKSIGDPVLLEPKYFRSGSSFTSSICRGNY